MSTTALVTGATGYIGARVVPLLLDAGWSVRVLTRSASKIEPRSWASRVDVVEGDADSRLVLEKACRGVDVAYYLLHSMDGKPGFAERDAELAHKFGLAAQAEDMRPHRVPVDCTPRAWSRAAPWPPAWRSATC